MKKDFTKVLIVIGLVLVLVGILLNGLINEETVEYVFAIPYLAVALSCTFVLSKNEMLVNMGYILSSMCGIYGIVMFPMGRYMLMISAIGMILMLIAAVIYTIARTLEFSGFVKTNVASDAVALLIQYKHMEKEAVITTEEFEMLKNKTFENSKPQISSLEDLKKWKSLLDQQIITEEEFASLKSKVF